MGNPASGPKLSRARYRWRIRPDGYNLNQESGGLGPAKTVANLRRGLAKAIRPSRSLPADRNSLTLLLDYDLS